MKTLQLSLNIAAGSPGRKAFAFQAPVDLSSVGIYREPLAQVRVTDEAGVVVCVIKTAVILSKVDEMFVR